MCWARLRNMHQKRGCLKKFLFQPTSLVNNVIWSEVTTHFWFLSEQLEPYFKGTRATEIRGYCYITRTANIDCELHLGKINWTFISSTLQSWTTAFRNNRITKYTGLCKTNTFTYFHSYILISAKPGRLCNSCELSDGQRLHPVCFLSDPKRLLLDITDYRWISVLPGWWK